MYKMYMITVLIFVFKRVSASSAISTLPTQVPLIGMHMCWIESLLNAMLLTGVDPKVFTYTTFINTSSQEQVLACFFS